MGFFNRLLGNSEKESEQVIIDEDWFSEICDAISSHSDSARVDYGDAQRLEVVGESFYQDNLQKIAGGKPGADLGWMSGFLVPEPFNEFDSNAVAVYVILESKEGFEGLKVGHLPKMMAARTQLEIGKKLAQEKKLVPLLVYLMGGTPEKPNYGVDATAKTDDIDFY